MKRVIFDLEKNQTFEVYSRTDYDRMSIDSALYLRCYHRITDEDWRKMFLKLNYYKTTEMIVHEDSVCNIKLH
jgi:hypothetical protein